MGGSYYADFALSLSSFSCFSHCRLEVLNSLLQLAVAGISGAVSNRDVHHTVAVGRDRNRVFTSHVHGVGDAIIRIAAKCSHRQACDSARSSSHKVHIMLFVRGDGISRDAFRRGLDMQVVLLVSSRAGNEVSDGGGVLRVEVEFGHVDFLLIIEKKKIPTGNQ